MGDDRGGGMVRRLATVGERAVGGLLRWDEALVNRVDPPGSGAFDTSRLPWSPALAASWPVARAELDAMLEGGVLLPETNDLVGSDQGAEGRWTTYVLHWFGRWLPANCARCPGTVAALERVPGLQIAGFTVLDGRTHLPRHQGPAKSLRWQMGVRVPAPHGSCRLAIGDDMVVWGDGVTTAFDDRTPHEAWNDADESRYVLFAQVGWPVTGVTGAVHRADQRVFGRLTSRIPKQAEALDHELNDG